MPDCSVDAVVTDPPYGLSFMGKKWDYDVPAVDVWAECLRVLKPGGHLLAFAGTRTQHRMAVRIEDAGFEIRDMIAWVYGSGFPKSMDASKAIDKAAGAERERELRFTATIKGGALHAGKDGGNARSWSEVQSSTPATEAARQWQGWGTALKPALEPITVARKPLDGTVAANLLEHGAGGLNIDGCRIAGEVPVFTHKAQGAANCYADGLYGSARTGELSNAGRWPSNFIHDGSDQVVAHFPQTCSGTLTPEMNVQPSTGWSGGSQALRVKSTFIASQGSAARFFYCAKADKSDRDAGLHGFEVHQAAGLPMRSAGGERGGEGLDGSKTDRTTERQNTHPTVKPTDLMRYLCRLVTQPGGVVLDPFTGSGSTGKAAVLEGFNFIGIEREAEYLAIARARIEHAQLLKAAGADKLEPASKRDAHTVDLFSEPAHP
jgi:site-specific DNA-methyltransferase (adenine-specific)